MTASDDTQGVSPSAANPSTTYDMILVITMENKSKSIDPLPDSFGTEEEAGAFWDAHSTADYKEYLEPTEDMIEIKERVFEISVAEDVFRKLQKEATSLRQPVPKIVDEILRKELL